MPGSSGQNRRAGSLAARAVLSVSGSSPILLKKNQSGKGKIPGNAAFNQLLSSILSDTSPDACLIGEVHPSGLPPGSLLGTLANQPRKRASSLSDVRIETPSLFKNWSILLVLCKIWDSPT